MIIIVIVIIIIIIIIIIIMIIVFLEHYTIFNALSSFSIKLSPYDKKK